MDPQQQREAAKRWDGLHSQARFRPRYPSEHVVRFLLGHYPDSLRASGGLRAIDIGMGGGRHSRLLGELGFAAVGSDISIAGLLHTRESVVCDGRGPPLVLASMAALPFRADSFDAAVSFGVFYYGNCITMRRAIGELYRTLKPGGWGFVVLRTVDDYRYGKGEPLEPDTFRLTISDTNELGAVMHFLSEGSVPKYFEQFALVEFEKAEATFRDRTCVNSDWLITVRK